MNQRKYGAILSYISLFIGTITGLLFTPFMLRMLGQAEYGLYSLVGSLVGYLAVLDLGLGNAIVRYISKYRVLKDKKNEENFLALILIFYSIIAAIVIIIGIILCNYLPQIFGKSLTMDELAKAKTMFILLIGNITVTLLFNSFNAVLTAYEKFVFQQTLGISKLIIRTSALIVLLSLGYKAITIVIVDTVLNIIFNIIILLYSILRVKIKIKVHYANYLFITEIFSYSFFIFLNMIMDQIYWKIDNVILGIMTNTKIVAIYALGFQLTLYYFGFSTAISGILMPKIVKSVETGATGEDLTDEMIKIGRIQTIILGLILSGFILFGQKFVSLWAGQEYKKSFWVAMIVMIPLTVPLFQNIGISILQAKNKHRFRAIMLLIMAVINIGITIILVKLIGFIGAAIGTAFVLSVGQIVIMNIYYHKVIGLNMLRFFKELSKGILPVILISLAIGFFIRMINGNTWFILGIQVIVFLLIYGLLAWFVGMNSYEKDLVKGILKLGQKKVE
jgi:O-antigen/teichoic acid export membrane protein